jgi:hypothetical protein
MSETQTAAPLADAINIVLEHPKARFADLIREMKGVASKSTLCRYRRGENPMNELTETEVRRRLAKYKKGLP